MERFQKLWPHGNGNGRQRGTFNLTYAGCSLLCKPALTCETGYKAAYIVFISVLLGRNCLIIYFAFYKILTGQRKLLIFHVSTKNMVRHQKRKRQKRMVAMMTEMTRITFPLYMFALNQKFVSIKMTFFHYPFLFLQRWLPECSHVGHQTGHRAWCCRCRTNRTVTRSRNNPRSEWGQQHWSYWIH